MQGSGRISLGSPELRGQVRVRDRSAYVSNPRRTVATTDGVIAVRGTRRAGHRAAHSSHGKHPSPARQHHSQQPFTKPALPRQSRSAVLARHTVAAKPNRPSAFTAKRSKKGVSLVVLIIALFIGGTGISYTAWRAKKGSTNVAAVLASTSLSEGTANVSEAEVSEEVMASYAVAPEMPRLIKIPRLQVNARVKRVGVSTTGTLETPSNVHDAGWYEGSAKPGKNDTTLINGHVHGTEHPGVFSRLSILKEGDGIQIERGDNKVIEYKVVRTESIDQDKIDLEEILNNGTSNKSSLVLMTSSSRYDVRTNKYEPSFIVYAVEQ